MEFQLKGIGGNMRCKLLQKRSTGKTTECSKHLRHIAIEKDIFSELNRCIFQISLKYIYPPAMTSKFCKPGPVSRRLFNDGLVLFASRCFLQFL